MKEEKKQRILVIDDDRVVLNGFKRALQLKGYTVDTAETGKEAIMKSKRAFYDLALIDIRLPDMEGTRLLSEMRDSVPHMVKIIVTGYPSQENAVEALNKGADAYIIKPILNTAEFLGAIKEHLRKHEEAKKYDEEKMVEYVKARAEEHEAKVSSRRSRK